MLLRWPSLRHRIRSSVNVIVAFCRSTVKEHFGSLWCSDGADNDNRWGAKWLCCDRLVTGVLNQKDASRRRIKLVIGWQGQNCFVTTKSLSGENSSFYQLREAIIASSSSVASTNLIAMRCSSIRFIIVECYGGSGINQSPNADVAKLLAMMAVTKRRIFGEMLSPLQWLIKCENLCSFHLNGDTAWSGQTASYKWWCPVSTRSSISVELVWSLLVW